MILGSNSLEGEDPNRETLATSTYHLHPDFNPDTLENDIAVIQLRMPVMLSGKLYFSWSIFYYGGSIPGYIQPIYPSSMDYQNNTDAISLGFGQTSDCK